LKCAPVRSRASHDQPVTMQPEQRATDSVFCKLIVMKVNASHGK
jgi:hypothetical protein